MAKFWFKVGNVGAGKTFVPRTLDVSVTEEAVKKYVSENGGASNAPYTSISRESSKYTPIPARTTVSFKNDGCQAKPNRGVKELRSGLSNSGLICPMRRIQAVRC